MDLIRIYEAPDEVTAQALANWLESNGIRTVIQPLSPAGFGGLGEELQGRWGDLLVDEAYEANAIPLINDYLASMASPDCAVEEAAEAGPAVAADTTEPAP